MAPTMDKTTTRDDDNGAYDGRELEAAIRGVAWAARGGDDRSDPLIGIHLECDSHGLRIEASDNYAMAVRELLPDGARGVHTLVQADDLVEAVAGRRGPVRLIEECGMLVVESPYAKAAMTPIEIKYPKHAEPGGGAERVVVRTEDLKVVLPRRRRGYVALRMLRTHLGVGVLPYKGRAHRVPAPVDLEHARGLKWEGHAVEVIESSCSNATILLSLPYLAEAVQHWPYEEIHLMYDGQRVRAGYVQTPVILSLSYALTTISAIRVTTTTAPRRVQLR